MINISSEVGELIGGFGPFGVQHLRGVDRVEELKMKQSQETSDFVGFHHPQIHRSNTVWRITNKRFVHFNGLGRGLEIPLLEHVFEGSHELGDDDKRRILHNHVEFFGERSLLWGLVVEMWGRGGRGDRGTAGRRYIFVVFLCFLGSALGKSGEAGRFINLTCLLDSPNPSHPIRKRFGLLSKQEFVLFGLPPSARRAREIGFLV